MTTHRFEFVEGKSKKFWQIRQTGKKYTVTYGRIGTDGQTRTKEFEAPAEAKAAAEKLIKQKTNKGYKKTSASSTPKKSAKKRGAKKAAPKRTAKGKTRTKSSRVTFRWRTFLKKVSRDLLKNISIREDLPKDVIDTSWLGYDGASEEAINTLEERLGKSLPPSYRSFLVETNGWRQCGAFIYNLWPCSKVAWFRERNQDWIDAYLEAGPEPEVSDDEYYVYDDSQDAGRFRHKYLESALEISDVGDSAVLLLNPEVVDDKGEWEAWLFANWLPGARRYRSFRDLMQEEHASFLLLQKELKSSKSKYGNAGQQAARRGETDKAMGLLRARAALGDQSSAVSLAELCAFRGLWDEVITCLGLVIPNLGEIPNFESYPEHLVQLLGRAGHETGDWKQISKIADAAITAENEREYDQYHEHVREMYVGWFTNLKKYCRRKGRAPHELTRLGVAEAPYDGMTTSERRKRYESALNDKHTIRKKEKPLEYAKHLFAIASVMNLEDEMIRIYEEYPESVYFKNALGVSRAYMKRGDDHMAWAVLRDGMNQSVDGLPEQVAPIALLVDETLRPLMTHERCEYVLSTPRGREADK